MPTERDDRLRRIYDRASALRNRRRALWSGAGGAVVVVAVLAVALTRGGDDRSGLTTVDGDRSTTTSSTIEVTTTASTIEVTTTASTKPPVCRNSYDPRCGPFRWDPPVTDGRPTITITFAPAQPVIGEEVVFTVTVAEPDGYSQPTCGQLIANPGANPERSDGFRLSPESDRPCAMASVACPEEADDMCTRYGPWDTPSASSATEHYRYVWQAPGDQLVRYRVKDMGTCDGACGIATKEVTVPVGCGDAPGRYVSPGNDSCSYHPLD